jgi:O-antigen/teichoic acid export membrane protein
MVERMGDPAVDPVAASDPAQAPRRLSALRGELSNPLFRNAYALMANGGLTGLLGLAYWTLGAVFYSAADVGRNWAEIQAIMFVGGVTMLNFLLIRFIPQTARTTGRLVAGAYALGSGAAALLGLGFLLTLDWWGPSFQHLHGFWPGLWFIAMAVAWNLFNQQEGAFTGLRRAGWVPVVNTVFGATKLALLLALAMSFPHDGVVLSWFIPVMVALVPVNAFIFGRLIPAHARENSGRGERPTYRDIWRYLGGGYIGGLFQYAAISLIPVIVAAHIDSTTNAYFQMAWALGMMLDLLALTLSLSLTVEGAFDPSALAESTKAALRRTYTLLIPVIVLVVVCAPFALGLLGHGYAARGAQLLQILAVATLPKALIELYCGVLRVQSRTRLIALLQGVRFLGVLGLVIAFIDPAHLATIGFMVLGVNVVVAAAIYPALRRAAAAAPTSPAAAPEDGAASGLNGDDSGPRPSAAGHDRDIT